MSAHGWRDRLASFGYGARDLPVAPYLPAHVAALVRRGDATEALDLQGRSVPLLHVVAGPDGETTRRELARVAAERRLTGSRPGEAVGPRPGVGVGAGHTEAVTDALHEVLARRALAGAATTGWWRLRGWQAAANRPDADLLLALERVSASVECYWLDSDVDVPVVGIVLRMPGSSPNVAALAAHVCAGQAVSRALWGAVSKLAVVQLLADQRSDGHAAPPPGPPWPQLGAADPTVLGERSPADLAPHWHERLGPVPELDRLRRALRAAGLRPETRDLLPGEATSPAATARDATDAGAVMVLGRLSHRDDPTGAADPPAPAATGEPPTGGPWRPLDVAALGLEGPAQWAFSYDPSAVALSRLYHENSKLRTMYGDLPSVDLGAMAPHVQRLLAHPVRDYRHAARRYSLPHGTPPPTAPVEECLRRRRSWAPMSTDAVSLPQLGHLLCATTGVTGAGGLMGSDVRLPLRATPAAGGLYSTDLYVYAHRVDGMDPGLYYHDPSARELLLVRDDASPDEIALNTGYASRAAEASAVLVYVASFRRLQWKYRQRAYRMAHLDCGHLAQSIILVANGLGLVAHPMIAFADDYFNDLVGVDGCEDAVVYLTLIGAAADSPSAPPRQPRPPVGAASAASTTERTS